MGQGSGSGQGFNPPNAGCDADFRNNSERPDFSGTLTMRPAAQLRTPFTNSHDAHPFAVLVAEKGHGPDVQGILKTHDVRLDSRVFKDVMIDQ